MSGRGENISPLPVKTDLKTYFYENHASARKRHHEKRGFMQKPLFCFLMIGQTYLIS